MKYYRLVEKDLNSKGSIIPSDKVVRTGCAYPAWVSLYYYPKEVLDYWDKNSNSISDYKGDCFADIIWFDIDFDDLEKAQETSLKLVKHLNDKYSIRYSQTMKYFSGKKGFHIGIPIGFIEGVEMSDKFPVRVKSFCSFIASEIGIKIDTAIYNHTRLFRLPNSMHHESGLYKIPLTVSELFESSVDEIKLLAAEPRLGFKVEYRQQEIIKSEWLTNTWNYCETTAGDEFKKSRVVEKDLGKFFTPTDVNRNIHLFAQACMLFEKSDLSFTSVRQIIESINLSSHNPINDEKEIMAILQSAYTRILKKKEVKVIEDGDALRTLGDVIPEFERYIKPNTDNISMLFDEFDKCVRGKYRGKLVTVIGQGGSKKSIFAHNFLIKNCAFSGLRGIYSTMEMAAGELASRMVDTIFTGEYYNYSFELELQLKGGERKDLDDIKAVIEDSVGDRILISDISEMTASKYDALIEKAIKRYGVVDFLVVDGLSMMEDNKGDEFKSVSFHSKELKNLAKKWDICVLCICHVTKDIDKTIRDLTQHIRGSGKVYDNSDYFISLSSIIDENSQFDDAQYRQDKGWAQFYAKRGNGMKINKVYDFDSKRLKIEPMGDDPSIWDFKKKKKEKSYFE